MPLRFPRRSRRRCLHDHPAPVAAAFPANILMVPLETPTKFAAFGHAKLVAYCQRMAQQYVPEAYSPR